MVRAHQALGCRGCSLYPKRMEQALSKKHSIHPFMRPPRPAAPALEQALPLRLDLLGLARPPLRALRRLALRPRLGQLLLRRHLAPPQRGLALLLGGQEVTIVQDNFLTVPFIIICYLQNPFYTLSRGHPGHPVNGSRRQGSWAEAGSGRSWVLALEAPRPSMPCPARPLLLCRRCTHPSV